MHDFDEYIRQGEPDKIEKSQIWQTAIGLQQVDGLKPSAYLIEQAKLNIEGDITIDEVKKRIDAYYGIEPTLEYLNRFFDNLLLGEKNELKNRFLHIKYAEMFPVNAGKLSINDTNNV